MSLDFIFNPKSVAIVGASAKKGKAGYKFVEAVMNTGYKGKLYFTNPSGGEVFGKKIYKSIEDIGEDIDVALIQVGREHIFDVLRQCEAAKAKAVILYTAGFGEADEAGAKLEAQLKEFVKRSGIRLVGPNCQGVFSARAELDLTGSGRIPKGNIGMISQSGGIGSHAWNEAANNFALGFSSFVSIGNQSDIEVHEYLEYLGDDPDTKAIVLYLEGLRPGSGRKFFETARRVSRKKPIVAIKGGQTKSGQRAANSHTGSLAGEAATFSSALREAGVVEVKNVDEMLAVTQALLFCEPLATNKLALVGFGGGHSTLAADAAEKAGFEVPAMSDATDRRLEKILPYWAPRKNPIDLAGGYLADLRLWVQVMRAALEEDGIGGALLFGSWAGFIPDLKTGDVDWELVTKELAALQQEYGKPIICFSHTGRGNVFQNATLRSSRVPVIDNVDTAMKAFSALRFRADWLRTSGDVAEGTARSPAKVDLGSSRNGITNLTENEAYEILVQNGISVAPYRTASSQSEVGSASQEVGYPAVLKISSRKIIHKSDVKGVETGLKSKAEVEDAYRRMIQDIRRSGADPDASEVLIAKQVGGRELIVGYVRDEHFGPTVMVGIGGIFVEILKDFAIRLAPVSAREARAMLGELKAAPLLFGARGQSPVNVDEIVRLIVSLGDIGSSNDRIAEIDLNPVFADATDATVADARIILSAA